MEPEHRICIFLTGGIGDFVASLQALHRVRRGFPRSKILLVGNPLWLPLTRVFPLVDEARCLDDIPLHEGFMRPLPEDCALSRFLRGFHLIISWFGDREGKWEETLQRSCPGRVLVHPYHRVHAFEGHVSEYYLATLEGLGLGGETPVGRGPPLTGISLSPALSMIGSKEEAAGERTPLVCMHPGSGSVRKNWPKEAFLEVSRGAFQRWKLPSAVVLGPAEKGQLAFWNATNGPHLSVREGLSILETSRVLRGASIYVGNDSGITHLAAALGTPVVALFGPTDPGRWGPRGPGVEILLQPVSPQQVLSALGRLLGYSSMIL
jgi:ADP-heptose:LPS heptosyltransferase